MSHLPIEPYLIELLRAMGQQGFRIIVAGGLGIYLKHRWVQQQERKHLFSQLPDARATDDIDSFLALEVFIKDRVKAFREILTNLGYEATETGKYLQYSKPLELPGLPSSKLDFHARMPQEAESALTRETRSGKMIRLGCRPWSKFNTLNAWGTPEAFAIDEGVQEIPLVGQDPAGLPFEGVVLVPHPFTSLCMKLRAAADYEATPLVERDHRNRKHAFDVYLLMAMLSDEGVTQVKAYAQEFDTHPEMATVRANITEHFTTSDASACRTLRNQLGGQRGEPTPTDLDVFCATLRELFAL